MSENPALISQERRAEKRLITQCVMTALNPAKDEPEIQ